MRPYSTGRAAADAVVMAHDTPTASATVGSTEVPRAIPAPLRVSEVGSRPRAHTPPRISVIVPTYNRCASLRRLLEALDRQALPAQDYEVIVVADGSSDGTREMLATFVGRFHLEALWKPNAGRATAVNHGIRRARGELLVLLDDDMEPTADLLAAHARAHASSTRLGVLGGAPILTSPSSPPVARHVAAKFNRHLERLASAEEIHFKSFYSGNFSIRRDDIQGVGLFDEAYRVYGNEDTELALRLLRGGVTLRYAGDALAHQHYDKDFAALAWDNFAKGTTAVLTVEKHPDEIGAFGFDRSGAVASRDAHRSLKWRLLRALLLAVSRYSLAPARLLIRIVSYVERREPAWLPILYLFVVDFFYALGMTRAVREGEGAARATSRLPSPPPTGEKKAARYIRTVVHFTDTAGFGGAEQMILTTLAGLNRQRWRPILAHYPNPGATQFAAAARRIGIETCVVPGATGWRGMLELPRLAKILREVQCSVLHAHLVGPLRGTKAFLAARIAGVPVVIATQHLFFALPQPLERLRQRFAAALVDRYIAVSGGMAQQMGSYLARPEQVMVLHNAIDPAQFAAPAGGGSNPEADARPLVLTLARLHQRKGVAYLLEAAAAIPECTLLIAGDGPERSSLEAEAMRLGISSRTHFLGTRSDARDLLQACTVFVLPSLAEGLPVSVIEAMAAGRPVVATDIEGTDEIVVDGETGFLVPPRDAAVLADRIRKLLEDPDLRCRMASAGQARVKRLFSVDGMVGRLEALYDDLLCTKAADVRS